MAKKKYSVYERAKFHENRLRKARSGDSSISDEKQRYSSFWLLGFNDTMPGQNLAPVLYAVKHKKHKSKMDRIADTAFFNGLKANFQVNNFLKNNCPIRTV